jgi:hypothetical protein
MVASKRKTKSFPAQTPTSTFDDGTFVRTAIVLRGDNGEEGSLDVVDRDGKRIAQINLFWTPDDDEGRAHLMADVIDVDGRFTERRALVFSPRERRQLQVPEGGNLVGVDFRSAPPKEDS